MMREFGKPNETTPVVVDAKPLDNFIRRDEDMHAAEVKDGMRPFHVEVETDGSNNTAKIIGGVVVGLLIIGGGIYAYESSRSVPVQQQVALKTPAQNQAAPDQAAAAPENSAPDANAAPTPAAAPASPPPSRRMIKSAADNSAPAPMAAPAQQSAAADPAINAPMTLTPQTAPPPEQAAPAGQTAMQQPVTAPDVSGQTNQPTPSVADNGPASAAPRTLTPQLQAPDSQTQPATPAQLPAVQAQDPAAQ
jgi:hypothetical protein